MSTIMGMELENVNTHIHTKLDFGNGVIVLLGENGVGKSTILRMIGHVLFDYISTSQGEFVSKLVNGKSGFVRVWLKGRDGAEYVVERNVGGASKYLVQRMPGFKRIEELKNKESILKWLKDLFGMDPDYDLSTIFQHAVGVDQGAFTAPFLFTPAERKAIFNPILKLDVYDTLVDKFLEINRIYEQKHTQLEVEIGKLKVKVDDKKMLAEKKKNLEAQIAHARQHLAIISKNVKDTKVTIDGLKKLKVDIENLEREKNALEKSIVQSESQLKENDKLVQSAKGARILCEKAEPGYRQSISLKEAENAALADVHALAKANERKSKEQTLLVKIQSEIEQARQTILDITEKMKELPALTNKREENARHEKAAAKLQGQAGEITAAKQAYKENIKAVSKMESAIKQLEARLKNKAKYETSVSRLAAKRAEESRLQNEIGKISATIAEYKRSKDESKGDQCPLLHETCKNIRGESLEAHFQTLIDGLAPTLDASESALHETKLAISAAEQDEKLLKSLEAEGARKDELDRQMHDLRDQMETQKASISSEQGIKAQIDVEMGAMAALQPFITQLGVIETMARQLPGLERKRADLEVQKKTPEATLKTLEGKIQGLGDVQGKLETIRGKLKALQIDYDSYQNNIKLSSQLESLESSHASITSTIGGLKQKDGALLQKIDLAKQGFDPDKLTSLEDDYNKQTKAQGTLEGELSQGNEALLDVTGRLDEIQKIEEKAKNLEKESSIIKEVWDFGEKIRSWYKLAGPKLADVLLAQINISASQIFRTLCGDTTADLKWTNDFEVQVSTPNDKSVRTFRQLSGGEQMMAAIAVRLALLQRLSNIRIAFFDEPTGNLDVHKKRNLASVLANVRGFNQLFVISHDSTFEGMANQVIKLAKDSDGRTRVI